MNTRSAQCTYMYIYFTRVINKFKLNSVWLQKVRRVLKPLAVKVSENGPAGLGFCVKLAPLRESSVF